MAILKYEDYLSESKIQELLLESKVIFSKKFINILSKMKSNKIASNVLDLYSKDVDGVTQNYIDITDQKDAVSFTPDRRVQELTKDKPETWIITESGKYLTKSDRNDKIFEALGYDKENIHIVWVVNHFEKAKEQNAARARSVSDAIMVSTHKGAAMTMHDLIMSNGTNVQNYMDGDIWVVFNLAGEDSEVMKSAMGGSYVKEANYIKVKQRGKKPEIDKAVSSKIASYVPATGSWK